MDRNKIICRCMNVSAGAIEDAFKAGATTFEAIQAKTKCSTGCGCCKIDVEKFIEELKK